MIDWKKFNWNIHQMVYHHESDPFKYSLTSFLRVKKRNSTDTSQVALLAYKQEWVEI
jgi:hypothetical protein